MKKKTQLTTFHSSKPGVKSPALPDPLQMYLREIAKYPVLSKEEEMQISREFYKTRDPQLAKILAQSNLRFVVKIAAEYTRFGARLLELVQEGNIGLLNAIKEFNPYKGVKLITYAVWWIRGYIQEYLMRQHSLVRIGTSARQRKLFYLLRKEQEKLKALPLTDFKKTEVENMQQRLNNRDVSLDKPSEQTGLSLLDKQSSEEESSPEETLNIKQEIKKIKESIKKLRPLLNEKETVILDQRLLSNEPMTLQKIGDKYSITREAVRQIEHRLIKKIKSFLKY